MELVNHSAIQGGVITYLQSLPLSLSTLKDINGNPVPSVIRDRQKIPRPAFPYITVDVQLSSPEGGTNVRDIYVDDDDVVHHVSEHTVMATISSFGDNALSILHTVQQILLVDQERIRLRTLTGEEAVYQRMTEISENPLYLETDFIDAAEMSIVFTVVSDYYNPDSEYTIISTVEVDGKYLYPDGTESIETSLSVSDTNI